MEYSLKAPAGSKVALRCKLLVTDCEKSMITLSEGGVKSHHCGPEKPIFSNSSSGNSLLISMIQDMEQRVEGSFCLAEATKPFLDFKEAQIDSSEHGAVQGKRKTSCPCGWANKESNSRVLGGNEASENEFPFIASLISTKNLKVFCGGSIIADNLVLTAAHCTHGLTAGDLMVVVGEHDTTKKSQVKKTIAVSKIAPHEEFVPGVYKNDIAILVLKEKVQFSKHVGRICMPTRYPAENDYVKVMGWGATVFGGGRSDVLRETRLRVIDTDICRIVYRIDTSSPKQFCTYSNKKDSCQGDSGGPLVWLDPETNRYSQVGIVSFGKECGSTDPGVNTNVFQYMDWIQKVIKANQGAEVCSKV